MLDQRLDAGMDSLQRSRWAGPMPPPAGPLTWLRRFAGRHPFKLTVLLPTLLAAVWLFGFAAPQYDSEARFLIRGRQAAPTSGLGDMMQAAGFRPAQEDAMGVRDYLQSHDAVAALRSSHDLVAIYRRPEADPLAKLWWATPTAERLHDYLKRMIGAEYDTTSGITTLRVKSFRAEDSQALTEAPLLLSESLVNRLNRQLQEDGLRVAREEVTRSEARLTEAQLAMTGFRERERAVDPARSAALTLENIGKLEGGLAQSRAELTEALRFARGDNPRVLQLRNRIEGLAAQVVDERARMSSTEASISQQVGEFERLGLERDLARTQFASATGSLERARVDAQRQQIFLLRVVEPNLAEYPRYPKAMLTVAYMILCLSVGYGLTWLLLAGMREHAA